jgi:hypothetical protein
MAAAARRGGRISSKRRKPGTPAWVLAAAHLDHNPGNNRQRNLKSLCQRCHMIHDRPHHLMQRRITYMLRRTLGELFLCPYDRAAAAVWSR